MQPTGSARSVTPPTVRATAHDVRSVNDENLHKRSVRTPRPGSNQVSPAEDVRFCRGEDVERPLAPTRTVRAVFDGPNTGQEIAVFTSSEIFFSTMGLHFLRAYDTGHRSPSSRLAASWNPRVEYR